MNPLLSIADELASARSQAFGIGLAASAANLGRALAQLIEDLETRLATISNKPNAYCAEHDKPTERSVDAEVSRMLS